jgi:hypothetical protein
MPPPSMPSPDVRKTDDQRHVDTQRKVARIEKNVESIEQAVITTAGNVRGVEAALANFMSAFSAQAVAA